MSSSDPANKNIQLLCLWFGPVGIFIWLLGFVYAGIMSPVPPNATAVEVAKFYAENATPLRICFLVTMIGSTMTAPMVAAISTQMKRIEGYHSPLTYTQLGLGISGILLFIIPVMNMQAATFRPDRAPELVNLASDMGWIPFVGVWTMAAMQNIAIGLAVFMDKKSEVFPRWVGYFNFWTALLYCPGSLLYFFKTGPFAWNGLLSWWLVVVVFCAWFVVMFVMTRKAIIAQPE